MSAYLCLEFTSEVNMNVNELYQRSIAFDKAIQKWYPLLPALESPAYEMRNVKYRLFAEPCVKSSAQSCVGVFPDSTSSLRNSGSYESRSSIYLSDFLQTISFAYRRSPIMALVFSYLGRLDLACCFNGSDNCGRQDGAVSTAAATRRFRPPA